MLVYKSYNPLVVHHDNQVVIVPDGLSPNEVIERGLVVLDRPTILLVDDRPWGRNDWDLPIPDSAECRFVGLPQGGGGGGSNPLRIIAMIAVMVASYYTGGAASAAWGPLAGSVASGAVMIGGSMLVNALFPADSVGANRQLGTPKSIYAISQDGNKLAIGQPFPEQFGRCICYPTFAQISYARVEDNEQYLYFFGIIGWGEYDIEGVCIDKTPLKDYTAANYNILPPGTPPTITTNVVWISAAATGQEISTDWFTCVVGGPGTKANYLEYDVVFAGGLSGHTESGDLLLASVTLMSQARLINYLGKPIGGWLDLNEKTYTYAVEDPLRFSEKFPAPDGIGRYEFRVLRTRESSTTATLIDRVALMGVRAYGGLHPADANCTRIEAKILATDRLSGEVANRINIISTRMLRPVTEDGFGPDLVATRSIVDACAYIVTTSNGGKQPSNILLFPQLAELRTEMADKEHFFDWRFESRTNVMDACSKAAKCSMAVPYMPSGLFSLVQDEYQPKEKMVFTDDDFTAGSLKITHAFRTSDAPTCMRVAYVDPDTWQGVTINCYDEGGSEETPQDITLEGCTSRQQAWEVGMRLYFDDWYNKSTVEFMAGLKGYIPSLFAKVMIPQTSADWGSSGKVAAMENGQIWTSEPLDFKGEASGYLYISDSRGESIGPITVFPTEYAHCVEGYHPEIKTILEDDVLATSYSFGPASVAPLLVRIMGILPQGRNNVRVIGTMINDDTYQDVGTAPTPDNVIPADESLLSLSLSYIGYNFGHHEFYVSWIGSATEFLIERNEGAGYEVVEDHYFGYNIYPFANARAVVFRVTPYVSGALHIENAQTIEHRILAGPVNIRTTGFYSDSVAIAWNVVGGADRYHLDIYHDSVKVGSLGSVSPATTISADSLKSMGGPWADLSIRISAIIANIQSLSTLFIVNVPPLPHPDDFSLQSLLTNGVLLTWEPLGEAESYKLYRGATPDFNPTTEGSLVYSGPSNSAAVIADLTEPYLHYFKVTGINRFDTGTNFRSLTVSSISNWFGTDNAVFGVDDISFGAS